MSNMHIYRVAMHGASRAEPGCNLACAHHDLGHDSRDDSSSDGSSSSSHGSSSSQPRPQCEPLRLQPVPIEHQDRGESAPDQDDVGDRGHDGRLRSRQLVHVDVRDEPTEESDDDKDVENILCSVVRTL